MVTGIGAVTPLGIGAERLHERWVAGETGIEDGVGSCRNFDPRELLGAAGAVEAVATIQALRHSFGFGGHNAVLCFEAAANGSV